MYAVTILLTTYIDVLRLYNTTSWTFPVEKIRNNYIIITYNFKVSYTMYTMINLDY